MKTTVYSRAGVAKYEAGNLEFHDSWMGEEYVTFSLESPYPINIEIGDYLVYRGHTYSAYNVPSALKQARRNSYGAAFKYDNVKFSSRSAEMADTDMHDIVLYDNNIHYTSLPKFSVYCETFDDLLDRLQANMNRNGGWQWIFLSPNFQRVSQRYPLDNPLRAEAISLWEEYYGSDHDHPTADTSKEKRGVNISFDDNSVWDAVGKVHEVFGVNYLCYDRVVVVGAGGVPADKIFRYGKGNGLATIERIADNDQKVVTRLFAYGSNKNLPLRYYSDLAWKPFMTVTYKEDMSEYDDPIYFRVQLDMPWAIGTYKEPHPTWHNATLQQDLIGGWAPVVVSLDMKTPIAYTNPYSGERNSILTCDMVEHNLYQQFVKGQARLNGLPMELYDTIEVGTRIYFLDGVYRESFNDQHRGYDLAELPNNMAVDFLMLPGFPKYSLNELCRCVEENGKTLYQIRKDTDTQNYSTFLEVDGSYPITFSTDKLKPYIQSQNAATLGIKEGNIFFDEENDDNGLKEVYPSIEEMTVGDVFGTQSTERLDELADAQIVEDNGVFEEGKEVGNVWVALKDLGFNLQWAINNSTGDAQISFKDGYCSGRTFSIKGVSQNEDGTWKVSLQREVDNSVHLYFPYSSAAARGSEPSSDEAYQLQAGDHFVLTGISLSDTSYVWAASVRALRKAIVWLLANDYTRFTYRPAVDEIFMQRQHDAAMSGEETIEYGSVSLHDTLKAGMLMLFEDTDLDVDGSLFIDSLTIKEGGNNGIPTYDVVLREEKQVGTLQKMQNEVNSVSSSLMSGAGGLSIPQVEGLIKTYGKEWFLSRVADDVAQGFIGFVKGLWVKTRGLFGIDENGDAKVHSLTVNEDYGIDEDGDAVLHDVNTNNVVTKTLTAQEAHFFNLVIDEARSVGGQIVVSPANAELVLATNSGTDYTCYFKAKDSEGNAIDNQWAVNDLALHMEFNVASANTRNYWARVKAVGTTNAAVGDYAAGDLHYIVLSYASGDYKVNQDYPVKYPQAGDYVVVMGNTSDDSRRNAIVISAYNIPFIDSLPFMGDAEGIKAPLFVEYSGVNGFNVTDGMRRNVIARNGTRLRGDFQVWNGSSSSYSSITAIIQALSDSITLRVSNVENTVAEIDKKDSANLIPQSTFPYGDRDENNKWFSTGIRNITAAGQEHGGITNHLVDDPDAAYTPYTDNEMGACLYVKEHYPQAYVYPVYCGGIRILNWGSGILDERIHLDNEMWYTLSWWQKVENAGFMILSLAYLADPDEYIYVDGDGRSNGNNTYYSSFTNDNGQGWVRHVITFKTRAAWANANAQFQFLFYPATTTSDSVPAEAWITRVQLEKGKVATEWKPAGEDLENRIHNTEGQIDIKADEINGTITNLNNGLEIAGVHVDATTPNNSEIRLKANKVKIQTYTEDSGATDTLFTTVEEEVEEGGQTVTKHRAMVKTDYVQATEVVTKGLQAQTIDAENATIENLNVTNAYVSGELQSSVGKIGNFVIGEYSLTSTGDYSSESGVSLRLTQGGILFQNPKSSNTFKSQAAIGANTMAGYGTLTNCPAKFEVNVAGSASYGETTTGIFVSAQGITGASIYPPNHLSNGRNNALYLTHGGICGLRLTVHRVSGNYTLTTMDSVLFVTAAATITMPSNPEDGQLYIIRIAYGKHTIGVVRGSSSQYFSWNGATQRTTFKTWSNGNPRYFLWDAMNNTWQVWTGDQID